MFFQKKPKTKINLSNFRDYLPIGSIVKLGDSRKYLISGVGQFDERSREDYDYIGVPYPEGHLGNECNVFFDHVDIKNVVHTGFIDEDYQMLIDISSPN
jgi:hypothetical protein